MTPMQLVNCIGCVMFTVITGLYLGFQMQLAGVPGPIAAVIGFTYGFFVPARLYQWIYPEDKSGSESDQSEE